MNARGKSIDKTHLSLDQAEERMFLHRDYIAHCLRWTHIARYLYHGSRYKTVHILDIGCGRDVPLAKTMFTGRLVPEIGSYTGVDYNKLEMPAMFEKTRWKPILIDQVAFPDVPQIAGRRFDVIVCLEVLEHVEPLHALKMLEGIREHLIEDGTAFVSSPCYDVKVGPADNHVSELSHDMLGSMIEHVGLGIKNVFGTFASIRDYKEILKQDGYGELFERLSGYYDTNYLATIFAPLYPKLARNCLWELGLEPTKQYPHITAVSSPRGSSEQWEEFDEYIQK